MRNASSNESNPGGPEATLRFPFLPPTHVIIKHATLAIVLAIIGINVPSTNVPTVPADPLATTLTTVLFVAAPPHPLPAPLPILPDDRLVPPIVLPSLLPRLVVPICHTPDPGAHGTGTAPPFLARTTLISMKTFPATELLTALAGATLLGPPAGLNRATFSLRRSLRVSEGVMLRFSLFFTTSLVC